MFNFQYALLKDNEVWHLVNKVLFVWPLCVVLLTRNLPLVAKVRLNVM